MMYYHVCRKDSGMTIAIFKFLADAEYYVKTSASGNYGIVQSHSIKF